MSAGICGKRLGFDEFHGSPATSPSSSSSAVAAKRARCSPPSSSTFASSIDVAFGYEERITVLLHLFPSMDREVVERVLNSHDHKVDDAIKSLNALCIGDDSAINEMATLNSMLPANHDAIEGNMNVQMPKQMVGDAQKDSSEVEPRVGTTWVDIFVQEMMNASNWDDVRSRATKILQDFERNVIAHSTTLKEQEIALLREQLQNLLKENQILKRAVAIQHEHSLEHEERVKEVQQLKQLISQYQGQVRTLEMNNYTLKVHLQRAQGASSIPSQFHPDIF